MSMPQLSQQKWFGRILSCCVSTNSEITTYEMEHTSQPGIINVLLFTHGKEEHLYRPNLRTEELCKWAAKKCCIPRLFSGLFSLYNKRKKVWYSPARVIAPEDDYFVFRLRFHTSMDLTALEEKVVNYMFEQYRYDFHNDEMQGLSTEEALGLMVLDLVRLGREKDIRPLHKICDEIRFKDHLPKSLATNLTVLDRAKLKRKVQKSLESFKTDDRQAITFKVMFMVSLMEEKRRWGAEEFETVNGDRYSVKAAKGLQSYSAERQSFEDSLQFEDMIDLLLYPAARNNNNEHWVVHINRRNGSPKIFEVENQDRAESVAALIDGYYRLLVDYYHYLNIDCAPPSLVGLVKYRCHGPIPLSEAKEKLKEAAQPDGTFIIRQNPEDYDSFCLTVQMKPDVVRNYKICVYEDGKIGLPNQSRFESIRQFMEYYRDGDNAFCLHNTPLRKAVQFKNKEPKLRMVDHSSVPLPPTSEEDPRIEWVPESDMVRRSEWKKLGRGAFTVVYRGEIRKRNRDWFAVALKSPKEKAEQAVKDKFSQSVDALASWKHPHIIRFQGIGGGRTPLLIMEYAQYGSLDRYLKRNKTMLKLSHQLTTAVQIINALDYLESRNIVHGNISARNVLVTRPATSNLVVKVGDPMLSVYYHSLDIEHKVKMKRVRWTAPELLCTNAEANLASDKWSYGITLWEIMAFGELPCADLNDKAVIENYKCGRRLGKPHSCPNAVYKIMEHCWLHVPQNRPQCRSILRDMNSILLISYREDGIDHNNMYFEPENPDLPPPIPEELSENEDEDDEDLANSDSSEHVMENGLDHPSQPPTPNGAWGEGSSVLTEQDRQIFQVDLETREFSSGAMIRWSNLGTREIDHGDVTIAKGQVLGQGQFGLVIKGEWQRYPGLYTSVAVKLLKDNARVGEDRKSFEEEIRRMSMCDHKNIVKVWGCIETSKNNLQMVMEFVKEGALHNYLRNKAKAGNKVPDHTLALFGQQICQGMHYLGDVKKLVHRDLAARNILVSGDAEIKISDFGLARDFTENKDYYEMTGKHMLLPIKWHSPESINEQKFSVWGDIWSFGVVLWEMFSHGESPEYGKSVSIGNPKEFYKQLEEGLRLEKPPSCPNSMYEIMMKCWAFKKEERPPFNTLADEQHLGRLREQFKQTP